MVQASKEYRIAYYQAHKVEAAVYYRAHKLKFQQYYRDHKEEFKCRAQEYRQRRIKYIDAVKGAPCADCGNQFPPECMDFDHVRGEKLFNVSAMRCANWSRLVAEIKKCDVVCANCHRKRSKTRASGV